MAPKNKINLKDRLEDGELDLSMSDLQEVPVKEIAALKKATSLDLSNNRLTTLPQNFTTLTHIIKLDLSNNQLTELPEDFGSLRQLKHLDLYNNQLTHLPLSFSELRALRWLDVKNNPLVPAVARVAGPCLDAAQCQQSARDLVVFFERTCQQIEEEKERREVQRLAELEAQEVHERQLEKKRERKRAARARKVVQKATARNGSVSDEAVEVVSPVTEVTRPLVQSERRPKRTETRRKPARRIRPSSVLAFMIFAFATIFVLSAWPNGPGTVIKDVTVNVWDHYKHLLPEAAQPFAGSFVSNLGALHRETGKVLDGPVTDALHALADGAGVAFAESRKILANLTEIAFLLTDELKKKII